MKNIFKLILLLNIIFITCSCNSESTDSPNTETKVNVSEMDKMVSKLLEKRINSSNGVVSKKEIFDICRNYEITPQATRGYSDKLSNNCMEEALSDKTLEEFIAPLPKEKQELFMILSAYPFDRPNYKTFEAYKESLSHKIKNDDDLKIALKIADFMEQNQTILGEFRNSASKYSIQSRGSLGPCDYCAAGAGVVISEMAMASGVAGAVAGPIGASVGVAAGIIGALGSLAYYSAFC